MNRCLQYLLATVLAIGLAASTAVAGRTHVRPAPAPQGPNLSKPCCHNGLIPVADPAASPAPANDAAAQPVAPGPTGAAAAQPAIDVELVDVRLVDAGDLEKKLGPCYRLRVRNNNNIDLNQAFNVAVAASLTREFPADSPAMVARVNFMKADQTLTIDLRLPPTALTLGVDAEGKPVPFARLVAVADPNQELNDTNRTNNGKILGRLDLPVVKAK